MTKKIILIALVFFQSCSILKPLDEKFKGNGCYIVKENLFEHNTIKGQIFEFYTHDIVPFAKIEEVKSGFTTYSDALGFFEISTQLETISLKISSFEINTYETPLISLNRKHGHNLFIMTKLSRPPLWQRDM